MWVPLPDWEDIYEVHPAGFVRRKSTRRILNTTDAGSGYKTVRLSNITRRERPYLHHLILGTFGIIKPPGTEADHEDRDKANNRIENLRWLSHKDNCANRDNRAIGLATWAGRIH